MPDHPALRAGRVAVITGAASGIGLAAAERFAGLGMKIVMADANEPALDEAAQSVAARAKSAADVLAVPTDVGRREDVERLKDQAYAAFGEVALLMNNAGRGGAGRLFESVERWQELFGDEPLGRHPRRAGLRAGDDRARHAGGHRQHRLQAGHHLPARQHRLQRHQGRREGRHRGARPRAPQHRGLPGDRAPPHPRLHLHGNHRADATNRPAPGRQTRWSTSCCRRSRVATSTSSAPTTR